MKRVEHIAVVTGTRAEFGLLEPVLRALSSPQAPGPMPQASLIVAGAHLVSGTWRDVKASGYEFHRVPMQRAGETGRAADVQAVARGVAGFGKVFTEIAPDIVLVLGDRIEAFAAATAASIGGQLVAHIHGGDRAEGVADEAMRHAISKLAHVHFAATVQSRRRLIRMGEDPRWVFVTGSPAMDGLRDVAPAGDAPQVIVMQHPIGAPDEIEQRWMAGTLAATRRHRPLIMMPNHDPGREGIVAAIRAAGGTVVDHLPRERWLGVLAGAKAIVGNSSAGLIEAAALKTACVNVGPRQAGREKPGHVIDCDYGERHVRRALEIALKLDLARLRHPYGDGRSGERIAEFLHHLPLDTVPRRKHNAY
jgi:UDP-hydrolysing UDP-N-acetyl-D-glucosamine 2-epimerase